MTRPVPAPAPPVNRRALTGVQWRSVPPSRFAFLAAFAAVLHPRPTGGGTKCTRRSPPPACRAAPGGRASSGRRGLAGAALPAGPDAGLADKARSRSRGGGRTDWVWSGGHLTGTDTLQRGERPALVGRDPHVDHRRGRNFFGPAGHVPTAFVSADDLRSDRVVGEAQVVVDVPLHQRAADVRHIGERGRSGARHRADELLRSVRLRCVDEALGVVGIERYVVVDRSQWMKCSKPVEAVADAVVAGGLGRLVVGPLREADDVDRDEVLSGACCSGVTPGTPPRSIGLRRVVGSGGDRGRRQWWPRDRCAPAPAAWSWVEHLSVRSSSGTAARPAPTPSSAESTPQACGAIHTCTIGLPPPALTRARSCRRHR